MSWAEIPRGGWGGGGGGGEEEGGDEDAELRAVMAMSMREAQGLPPADVAPPTEKTETKIQRQESKEDTKTEEPDFEYDLAADVIDLDDLEDETEEKVSSDEEDDDPDFKEQRSLYVHENLKKIIGKEKFADVAFIVGPKEKESKDKDAEEPQRETIYAHKIILASRSPVFKAMFYGDGAWIEKRSYEIEITDLSPSAFKTLLDCMYSDKALLTPNNVVEVLFAAKKYQVERLRRLCMRYMARGIGVKEACQMLDTLTGLLPEENASLIFIEDNATEVLLSDTWVRLSKRNVRKLLSSETLNASEEDLFAALVRWGHAECEREGLEVNPANMRSLLGDLVGLIRFPLMDMEQFSLLVPETGLVEPKYLLALYKYMGDKNCDEVVPVVTADYVCTACTFVNKGSEPRCTICQTPAPDVKQRAKQVDWDCPACTFRNVATNSLCDICRTPAPPPPKEEEKVVTGADFGFPFSLDPRYPRRPEISSMRFLILAAGVNDELNDVKDHVLRAYEEQHPTSASKKKLVVDVISAAHRFADSVSLDRLLEYDAVITWSGSHPYRKDISIGDMLAEYIDRGGGVVVCAVATNNTTNSYSLRGRLLTGNYLPFVPGPQATGPASQNATIVIPPPGETKEKKVRKKTDKKGKDSKDSSLDDVHPLLRNVQRFQGGVSSIHATVTAAPGAKVVATWSDGAPFLIEKKMQAKDGSTNPRIRTPMVVMLNMFPPSSRIPTGGRLGGAGQLWDQTTDGHHLLLNALAYAGSHSTLKTKKK